MASYVVYCPSYLALEFAMNFTGFSPIFLLGNNVSYMRIAHHLGLLSMLVFVKALDILGHLLFITYEYDVVRDISSSIRLFIDEPAFTSLNIVVSDPVTAAERLNYDLNTVHAWSKTWLFAFNPAKTVSFFSLEKEKNNSSPSTLYE